MDDNQSSGANRDSELKSKPLSELIKEILSENPNMYRMPDTMRTPFDGPMIVSSAPFGSSSDAPALPVGVTDGTSDGIVGENASGVMPGTSDEAWQDLNSALAACLADLDEGDALVISHKSSGAFVQFIDDGASGMRAEAVSNTYLPPEDQLSEVSRERLLALGWQAATYTRTQGAGEPPEGSPNYYLDTVPPVPYTDIATLAMESLRQVYRVRHPIELQYKAYNVIDRRQIRFPSLKLKREPTEGVANTDSNGSPSPGS